MQLRRQRKATKTVTIITHGAPGSWAMVVGLSLLPLGRVWMALSLLTLGRVWMALRPDDDDGSHLALALASSLHLAKQTRTASSTGICNEDDVRPLLMYLQNQTEAPPPHQLNVLRRRLAAQGCLDDRHVPLFRQFFLRRLSFKHVNLHIPKTGGTSICRLVKEHTNLTVPDSHNCWSSTFCPQWSGCPQPPPTTCAKLPAAQFSMNENWLDHPLCSTSRTYSMILREPVARTISHVDVFLDALAARGHHHFQDTKAWRLNLIQSNYMTWSLLAGLSADARFFAPNATHIPQAQRVLESLDYLLDLSFADTECTALTLEWMGLDAAHLQKLNAWGTKKTLYRSGNYQFMNAVDTQVYAHALEIMRADCDFYRKIQLRDYKE